MYTFSSQRYFADLNRLEITYIFQSKITFRMIVRRSKSKLTSPPLFVFQLNLFYSFESNGIKCNFMIIIVFQLDIVCCLY